MQALVVVRARSARCWRSCQSCRPCRASSRWRAVGLGAQQRQQPAQRRRGVADQAEVDGRPPADVLGADGRAGSVVRAGRQPLRVGEVGADHQQQVGVGRTPCGTPGCRSGRSGRSGTGCRARGRPCPSASAPSAPRSRSARASTSARAVRAPVPDQHRHPLGAVDQVGRARARSSATATGSAGRGPQGRARARPARPSSPTSPGSVRTATPARGVRRADGLHQQSGHLLGERHGRVNAGDVAEEEVVVDLLEVVAAELGQSAPDRRWPGPARATSWRRRGR